MTIRYEVNPPKINQNPEPSNDEQKSLLGTLKKRVAEISDICDGIHITDSVLGIRRISPLTTASEIIKDEKKLQLTYSLRTRDKSLDQIDAIINDSISIGLKGVLLIKGDASEDTSSDSGLIPSKTVKFFKELGYGNKTEFFLSLPANPDFKKIQKKIDAEPVGFVTQVISSIDQVSRIVDELKPQGFKIIPCIMLPSSKNKKSSDFLNIHFADYDNNLIEFINSIHKLTNDVLITSPNDFSLAQETLSKLS